jgi:hypothetical protein
LGTIRALARTLLPVIGPLPKRYWRWTWLAAVIRLVIGVPFFLVFIGPYLLAKGFVFVLDQAGGQMGRLPVACYNKDLADSGWTQAVQRAPAVQLSPEWAERLRQKAGDG